MFLRKAKFLPKTWSLNSYKKNFIPDHFYCRMAEEESSFIVKFILELLSPGGTYIIDFVQFYLFL